MGRVLLIRLSALGDLVLVEPAIRALRGAMAGVQVDLVTDARYAAFAERHLGADRVVPYDRHGEDDGAGGVGRVRDRIGGGRYHAVVDLQGKLRTRALARAVPAEHRLVLRKRGFGRALLAVLGHDPPLTNRKASALYLSVLEPLGVDVGAADLQVRLSNPAERRPSEGLRIGLAPGATHATKRWPSEGFSALAEALHRSHPQASIVLVGGPSDRAVLEEIRAGAPKARFSSDDVASLDVAQMAQVVSALDLMVSVDSGPAHLAAGFSVPTVVLFGPTSSTRWGPVAPAHRIVRRDMTCSPCSNTGGPRCPEPERNHACMQQLPVEDVLGAAVDLLEERAA